MVDPRAELCAWSEIKNQVKKLNPHFYKVIESAAPSDKLKLLLVKYPYGYTISDEKGFYLPKKFNNFLDEKGFDTKAPLTFVLEKEIEYHLETHHNHLPWTIHKPGDFFPKTVNAELNDDYRFYPKSIFTVTSGVRDATLLSLHNNTNEYYNLRRKYAIPSTLSPSNPLDHFHILKTIVEQEQIDWHSTLLVFHPEWQNKIQNDKSWYKVKEYLLESSLKASSCKRSLIYLNQAIHDVTRKMDYKFRPFTHEIIQQTLLISVGQLPGFRPATTNDGLPTDEITHAISNASRELLTLPVIMKADMLDRHTRNNFIYNSITYNTSTQYKMKSSPNSYLDEIMIHIKEYMLYFKDHIITNGTIYSELFDNLDLVAASTRGSSSYNIKKCQDIYELDNTFNHARNKLNLNSRYGTPINAQFCKGFIGVRWKDN